jgi:lactate dehydrogenase-like 2-hydroxyacid dehydrogenase
MAKVLTVLLTTLSTVIRNPTPATTFPRSTSDKDGANSTLDKELPDAEVIISQLFWPAYMTAERIAKAKKLKLIITAGISSDHTDLQAEATKFNK